MQPYTLTAQQKAFFDTFGYLHLKGLFKNDIAEIIRAFEEVWERRGIKHDGAARSVLVPFIDKHERLLALLDDPRIEGVAGGVAGEDFNYLISDGNYYVGDTNWHCDSWHEDKNYVKLALYLDPVTRDTGALRVIPGSHKLDAYRCALGDRIGKPMEHWGIHGRDIPAAALETEPGDLVLFHHNCLHASYGGSKARRMFTIDVCAHYPPEQLQELRDYLSIFARKGLPRMWSERVYKNAPPRRLRHVQQLLDNDSHMAELAKEAQSQGNAAYALN